MGYFPRNDTLCSGRTPSQEPLKLATSRHFGPRRNWSGVEGQGCLMICQERLEGTNDPVRIW